MTPYSNPYAPPQSGELYGAPVATGDTSAVPDIIVEHLRGTRPWVIFLAIVGFLCAGLCVLAGLGIMVMSAVAGTGKTEPFPMAIAGLAYLVFGGIYVLPCVGMIRYGMAIGTLIREPRTDKLAAALDSQRWFWKCIGIMTAVMMSLYPIGIVVAIVVLAARGVK